MAKISFSLLFVFLVAIAAADDKKTAADKETAADDKKIVKPEETTKEETEAQNLDNCTKTERFITTCITKDLDTTTCQAEMNPTTKFNQCIESRKKDAESCIIIDEFRKKFQAINDTGNAFADTICSVEGFPQQCLSEVKNMVNPAAGVLNFPYVNSHFLKTNGCKFQKLYTYLNVLRSNGCGKNVTKVVDELYKIIKCDGALKMPDNPTDCTPILNMTRFICSFTEEGVIENAKTFVVCIEKEREKIKDCKVDVVLDYMDAALTLAKKSLNVLENNKYLTKKLNNSKTCMIGIILATDKEIQKKRQAFTDIGLKMYTEYAVDDSTCDDDVQKYVTLLNGAVSVQASFIALTMLLALVVMKLTNF